MTHFYTQQQLRLISDNNQNPPLVTKSASVMSRGNLITVSRFNMCLNEQLLRFKQFDLLTRNCNGVKLHLKFVSFLFFPFTCRSVRTPL